MQIVAQRYEKIEEPKVEFEEGMYIYCKYSFEDGGKTYYYRTNNKYIEEGDYVLVPVGCDNSKKIVHVE